MDFLRTIRGRLRALVGRDAIVDEIDEEVAFHLEERTREYQRSGLSPADARRAAVSKFGNPHAVRDRGYDVRGDGVLGWVLHDLRLGTRVFRNHPGYVAMSSAVLAISIGINLTVFTFVNALWLRPLPFPEPDRVVTILQSSVASLDEPRLRIFEGRVAGQVVTVGASEGLLPRILLRDTGAALETLGVTPAYFNVLGLAVRGREFGADDEREGAEAVAIISDRLWTLAFGRRPEIIGTVVPAVPVPLRIIGVAPARFEGARRGERADLWIPTSLVKRLAPADWATASLGKMVFARLGPGQTIATLEQRYRELMEPQMREWLLTYNPSGLPTVVPVTDVFGTPESRTFVIREGNAFLVVSGLALLVLLGGCTTIAALVLTHYERRRAELALKLSLGAGRPRLVFELVRDLSLIAAIGSASGTLCALLGVRALPSLTLPGGVDIGRLDLSIDWRVGAVGVAAAIATMAVAAAVPVVRATRARLAGELLIGPAATTLGSLRVRQGLLALQVCATIVVLIAAGLFVRAVRHGFGVAPGFAVDRTVFVSVQEDSARFDSALDRRRLSANRTARLMPLLAQLPSVSDVAEGIAPIGAEAVGGLDQARTVRTRYQEHQLRVGLLTGSPNLLSVLGVPLLAGRALTEADVTAPAPHPVIMTAPLAQRLWPDGGALGETVSIPQLRGGRYVVVGIAGELAFGTLSSPKSGVIVTAGTGTCCITSSFALRTDHPESVSALVQQTVHGQVVRVATGRETIGRDIGRQRLGAWFFSGFGVAALLLGVGGAFGLVAYLAESRRREYGVRMALGATVRDLTRHGLRVALAPVSAGVAAGLVTGAVVSRLFTAVLIGISGLDVVTYVAVGVTMLSCAALAALVATWRLRGTTPSDALRAE